MARAALPSVLGMAWDMVIWAQEIRLAMLTGDDYYAWAAMWVSVEQAHQDGLLEAP